MSLAGTVADIHGAMFVAAYVRASGEKWQTLGSISQGVLSVMGFDADDSQSRNLSHRAADLRASCRMWQSSFVELQLLRTLCNTRNDFLFRLADGESPDSATAGWVYFPATWTGCKSRVVADGNSEDRRYVVLEWQGSVFVSDANEIALFKPTLAESDFESSADSGTFHDIGIYTIATDGGSANYASIRPCGIDTVTLADMAGGDGVVLSPIANPRLSFAMFAVEDDTRRYLPTSLDVDVQYEWMPADASDLVLLGNVSRTRVVVKIKMTDGLQFTLEDQAGVETDYGIAGGLEDSKGITFKHQGRALQSAFDVTRPWTWASTDVFFTDTHLKFSQT